LCLRQCGRGLQGCVLCALWDTRLQMGTSRLPSLVRVRELVGPAFRGAGGQDVVVFLRALLGRMGDEERGAEPSRGAPCPGRWWNVQGLSDALTHVERLFGFVEELRRSCSVCGRCEGYVSLRRMLVLPVPSDVGGDVGLSDLYLQYCWRRTIGVADCAKCRGRTEHVEQRRSSDANNIASTSPTTPHPHRRPTARAKPTCAASSRSLHNVRTHYNSDATPPQTQTASPHESEHRSIPAHSTIGQDKVRHDSAPHLSPHRPFSPTALVRRQPHPVPPHHGTPGQPTHVPEQGWATY
jgi:hypothetical protein